MDGIFAEVWRCLRDDGTVFVNMGDSYNAYNGNRGNGRSTLEGRKQCGNPELPAGYGLTVKGLKQKDLLGMPWRFALAMQEWGWYLRDAITWLKICPMPSSVRDRTTPATEMIFLFSKKPRYFYDQYAVRESVAEATLARDAYMRVLDDPDEQFAVAHDHETISEAALGRNLWNWWVIPPESSKLKHYALFPTSLPFRCLQLGTSAKGACAKCGKCWRRVVEKRSRQGACAEDTGADRRAVNGDLTRTTPVGRTCGHQEGGVIGWEPGCKCGEEAVVPCLCLDPFSGGGTTVMVARRLNLRAIGIELNESYASMSRKRILDDSPLFSGYTAPDESEPTLFPEES